MNALGEKVALFDLSSECREEYKSTLYHAVSDELVNESDGSIKKTLGCNARFRDEHAAEEF